ncbi:hypothetical protein ES703_106122 [subsurface metagenome]
MKSVLKQAEHASKELSQLKLKSLKLTSIKITKNNPDTGHFRLKGFLTENDFIEIFEFYFSGNLLKYSYTLVKKNISILRYDNSLTNSFKLGLSNSFIESFICLWCGKVFKSL